MIKTPAVPWRMTINCRSGPVGKARAERYEAAAKKAGKDLQSWLRDTLDQEADRILGKA